MSGPEPGAFVVEPVVNGWIVQHWLAEPELEKEPEASPGYDPSAEFAKSQGLDAGTSEPEELPDPVVRYVFQHDQVEDLLTLLQALTRQTIPAEEEG